MPNYSPSLTKITSKQQNLVFNIMGANDGQRDPPNLFQGASDLKRPQLASVIFVMWPARSDVENLREIVIHEVEPAPTSPDWNI